MSTFKLPPDPGTSPDYTLWRKDIVIWQKLTDLAAAKQGLALQFACRSNKRIHEAVVNIPETDVAGATGFANVLKVLDDLFKTDDKDAELKSYHDFETIHRKDDQTMADFINEFDALLQKTKAHGNVISENLLAVKLMRAANLTNSQQQMIKAATAKIDYTNIKATMKRTFGESTKIEDNMAPTIKTEPTFQTSCKGACACACEDKGHQRSKIWYEEECDEVLYGEHRNRDKYNYGNYNRNSKFNQTSKFQQKKGRNPLDPQGNLTRCNICESINHWAAHCPDLHHVDPRKKEGVLYEVIMFESDLDDPDSIMSLEKETLGAGVADCGASKTVCGRNWLNSYIELLTPEEQARIVYKPSTSSFKFGVGEPARAFTTVQVPITLGRKKVTLESEVVADNLPLLLSKSFMKRGQAQIDTEKDEIVILGQTIKMINTSSGHYAVPLTPKASVIHKLTSAGNHSFDKKPPPGPVVASRFNECVAVDIRFYHGAPLLHLVDCCTRYSVTAPLQGKETKMILEDIFKQWITNFGSPGNFVSSSEVFKEEFKAVAEAHSIVFITGTQHEWISRICERHSLVLCEMLERIMEEVDCSLSVSIAWATSSKNSIQSVHGFSPSQLVFGYNLIIPSVSTNLPPVLTEESYSNLIASNLSAMKQAREEFIRAESSKGIRRKLNHKSCTSSDVKYINGDEVYYTRTDDKRIHGPGVVIGQNSQCVLLKHQSTWVRVHPSRLQLIEVDTTESSESDHTDEVNQTLREEKILISEVKVGDKQEHQVAISREATANKLKETDEVCEDSSIDQSRVPGIFSAQLQHLISEAKGKELKIWKNEHVYKEVDKHGVMSLKWLIKPKLKEGFYGVKAHIQQVEIHPSTYLHP